MAFVVFGKIIVLSQLVLWRLIYQQYSTELNFVVSSYVLQYKLISYNLPLA